MLFLSHGKLTELISYKKISGAEHVLQKNAKEFWFRDHMKETRVPPQRFAA